MHRASLLVATLLVPLACRSSSPVPESPPPRVELELGALRLDVLSAELTSRDNGNTHFQAQVSAEFPESSTPLAHTRLRIEGERYPIRGWSGNERPSPLHFDLPAAATRTLAAAVPSILRQRSDPGVRLRGRFAPRDGSSGNVEVCFTLENVGDVPAHWTDGGQWEAHTGRDGNFTFRIGRDGASVPDATDPVTFGGLAALRTLLPGASRTWTFDLTPWCSFETPGTYEVEGRYALTLYDGASEHVVWETSVAHAFRVHRR